MFLNIHLSNLTNNTMLTNRTVLNDRLKLQRTSLSLPVEDVFGRNEEKQQGRSS